MRTPGVKALSSRPWLGALALALVLTGVLVVWGLLAVQRLQTVRQDLVDSREVLLQSRDALFDGDMQRSQESFAAAAEGFAEAGAELDSPAVMPIRALPYGQRSLDAVEVMAQVSADVAGAMHQLTALLAEEPGGLGALSPAGGQVPLEAMQRMAPAFQEVADALETGRTRVRRLPSEGVAADVADARAELLEVLEPAASTAGVAAQLTTHLPDMFGASGPRRYMVAASNPTEARGTGGFLGAFTIMTADEGELSYSDVQPIQDLPNLPYGSIDWPDPSLASRYQDYGGAGFWLNINMTPDFPSAATAIENLYEEVTGDALDGVIAVDPFAFEVLLELTGPVQVRGVGLVEADEVVDFVSHEAYATLEDPEERKRLVGEVALATVDGFLSRPADVGLDELLRGVGEMVERQSLLVHTVDPDVQQVLVAAGVAGALPDPTVPQYLSVMRNSATASKVDFYLHQRTSASIVVGGDGIATTDLELTFTNVAPVTGQPEYVIGPNTPQLEAGDNLFLTSVYCEQDCQFDEIPEEGYRGLATTVGDELGFHVASTWLQLPARETATSTWSWTSRGVLRPAAGGYVYTLHYDHQPSMNPVALDVEIRFPPWLTAESGSDGVRIEDGVVRWEDEVVTDARIEVQLSARRAS